MQIVITGADSLPAGVYGSVVELDGDTLRIDVDPSLDSSAGIPITKAPAKFMS